MSDTADFLAAWAETHYAWLSSQGVTVYPPGALRGTDLGVARYPILRGSDEACVLYGAAHAHGYTDAYLEILGVLSGPEARGRELEALNLMVLEGVPHSEVTRRFFEDAKTGRGQVVPLRPAPGSKP